MAKLDVGSVGDYIREQRRTAQYSLRQLAEVAGVSNPYLSQIERGLRKPSAEILQQIAKGLRISAETLYVRAGILEERAGDPLVVNAVLADPVLSERQKSVLLDIYETFRREQAASPTPTEEFLHAQDPDLQEPDHQDPDLQDLHARDPHPPVDHAAIRVAQVGDAQGSAVQADADPAVPENPAGAAGHQAALRPRRRR